MTPTKPKSEKPQDSTTEKGDQSSWEHDQKNKDYYYDDTCGYAVFEDDSDESENQENEEVLADKK